MILSILHDKNNTMAKSKHLYSLKIRSTETTRLVQLKTRTGLLRTHCSPSWKLDAFLGKISNASELTVQGRGDRCNLKGHPIKKATGHNYNWEEHSIRVAWVNFITSFATSLIKERLEKENNQIGYGTDGNVFTILHTWTISSTSEAPSDKHNVYTNYMSILC